MPKGVSGHAAAGEQAASRLRPRGSNQDGLRQYNEPVLLQAIRLQGALPGAELARITRLTAQTVSIITKRLARDGLLLRGAPQRGRDPRVAEPGRVRAAAGCGHCGAVQPGRLADAAGDAARGGRAVAGDLAE